MPPGWDIRGPEPYRFTGCGSHKFYANDGQVAGYRFRWCFLEGGTTCDRDEVNGWSTDNVITPGTAWKKCTGYRGCSAARNEAPTAAQANSSTPLEDKEDWSDCCRICTEDTSGCVQWSYDVGANLCHLFHTTQATTAQTGFYSGTPGYNEDILSCFTENQFDTCTPSVQGLFIAGMVLLGLMACTSARMQDSSVMRQGGLCDVRALTRRAVCFSCPPFFPKLCCCSLVEAPCWGKDCRHGPFAKRVAYTLVKQESHQEQRTVSTKHGTSVRGESATWGFTLDAHSLRADCHRHVLPRDDSV